MAAIAITAALGAAPEARAQGTSDQDAVEITARVVGNMVVDAQGQVIDLGQLVAGTSFSVASDGSSAGEVATFLLTAPAQADISFTVTYQDLTSATTSDVVTVGAPPGPAICYRQGAGVLSGPCDVLIANPQGGGVSRNQTGNGEGTASLGYTITVGPSVAAGNYSNRDAIILQAEALLGGPPGFP